jgi:hypothetical protein
VTARHVAVAVALAVAAGLAFLPHDAERSNPCVPPTTTTRTTTTQATACPPGGARP